MNLKDIIDSRLRLIPCINGQSVRDSLVSIQDMRVATVLILILTCSICGASVEKPAIWLSINRAFHGSIILTVFKQEECCHVLNVECVDEGISTSRVISSKELTSKQVSKIYALYHEIDLDTLRGLRNNLGADGSGWLLAIQHDNNKYENIIVMNPNAGLETEESKKLFNLGEYLWTVGTVSGALYKKANQVAKVVSPACKRVTTFERPVHWGNDSWIIR